MEIKHKSIRREPWARVLKRTQVFFSADDGGAASLLRFDKLTSSLIRDYGDGLLGTVAEEGGYWRAVHSDKAYKYHICHDFHADAAHHRDQRESLLAAGLKNSR